MKIVKMNASHIAALARLESECFSEPWSEAGISAELENTNAYFIVALEDEQIMGYTGMYCMPDVCYMANVAVFEKYRKKGVASALLNELIRKANECRAAELTLEVRGSNAPAINLYKKFDFKTAGIRKNFYKKPTEDAYIMTLFLCNL